MDGWFLPKIRLRAEGVLRPVNKTKNHHYVVNFYAFMPARLTGRENFLSKLCTILLQLKTPDESKTENFQEGAKKCIIFKTEALSTLNAVHINKKYEGGLK